MTTTTVLMALIAGVSAGAVLALLAPAVEHIHMVLMRRRINVAVHDQLVIAERVRALTAPPAINRPCPANEKRPR